DIAKVKIGKVTLDAYNPIEKKGDYVITWDKDAVEVGTYNFTITASPVSERVEGEFKGTFKVKPCELKAHFATKVGSVDV
ncbi:hypothetical protein RFZ03_16905, partial [Acinetobacter baumannii]|nr:hypothetical protein [Acinetobacter baumannii]